MDGLFIKLREEHGVAMVIVVLAIVVVTVIGAGLVIAATRDLESSTSVQRASSALGVAEAAVQHGMQQLRVLGTSEERLGLEVDDDSPDGTGRWMNPSDPTSPPPADVDGSDFIGFTGEVGPTGRYTAFILEIEPVDLSANPADKEGVYQIVATGLDRKDDPTRPGARKVEQFVRVRALDVPFALFSQTVIDAGGTAPLVFNESMYADDDILWRSKMEFEGIDDFYGHPPAAHATGTVYRGGQGAKGKNGPIHPPNANCDFPYDRDKDGGTYGSWTCTDPEPDYTEDSKFHEGLFPFDPTLPDEDTYQFLKGLAQRSGKYVEHTSNSTLVVKDSDLASMPKFFVFYVDVTGNGDVKLDAGWGPSGDPETVCGTKQPDGSFSGTYDGSFGIIVVRGGRMERQSNENWWGSFFVPEGELHMTGSGTEWLVGTAYANSMTIKGNFRAQLNDCWLNEAVGPFFTVSRLRWHESDRPTP